MAKRKQPPVVARKYQLDAVQRGWSPLGGSRIVYHGIKSLGGVDTLDGPMIKVQICLRAEFADPTTDVAALVGKVWTARHGAVVNIVPSNAILPAAITYASYNCGDATTPGDYPNLYDAMIEFAGIELWYWNDKFYLKAHDGTGVEWYKNRCFLFYEVDIVIPPGFIEAQTVAREAAEAARLPIN